MYNPCQISQTIHQTIFSLKQFFFEKNPKLNFPSYVKDRYEFDLELHFPKFPPLPTCELGLDFQLPLTKWCFLKVFVRPK